MRNERKDKKNIRRGIRKREEELGEGEEGNKKERGRVSRGGGRKEERREEELGEGKKERKK